MKDLAAFNSIGLSTDQLRLVIGRDKDYKWISRKLVIDELIKDGVIAKVINHGRLKRAKKCTSATNAYVYYPTRYLLAVDRLEKIFNDAELLAKVKDLKSDYYTTRQTELIFNYIMGVKTTKVVHIRKRHNVKPKASKCIVTPTDDIPDDDSNSNTTNRKSKEKPKMNMFQKLPLDEKIRYTKIEISSAFISRQLTLEHAQMLQRVIDKKEEVYLPARMRACSLAAESELDTLQRIYS